jgi:hypothetical protein
VGNVWFKRRKKLEEEGTCGNVVAMGSAGCSLKEE